MYFAARVTSDELQPGYFAAQASHALQARPAAIAAVTHDAQFLDTLVFLVTWFAGTLVWEKHACHS